MAERVNNNFVFLGKKLNRDIRQTIQLKGFNTGLKCRETVTYAGSPEAPVPARSVRACTGRSARPPLWPYTDTGLQTGRAAGCTARPPETRRGRSRTLRRREKRRAN